MAVGVSERLHEKALTGTHYAFPARPNYFIEDGDDLFSDPEGELE